MIGRPSYSRKRSATVGPKAAQSLYYATVEQARRIGMPLTHYITLNFSVGNRSVEDAVEAFAEMRRNRYNKWCRRPGKDAGTSFAPTYVYAFENKKDDEVFQYLSGNKHNVHVHWCVHVPRCREKELEQNIWKWFEEAVGGFSNGRAVNIEKIYDPVGLRVYVLKGSPAAKQYGSQYKPQGTISGRRTGTSRNLGREARIAMDRSENRRRWIPRRPRQEPSVPGGQ